MRSYRIRLRETRMATGDTDDVALFDVTCEENEQTWLVPVFLSPLFRLVQMRSAPAIENRREMVAGLGARAITERLQQGQESQIAEPLVLTTNYPGAPGDPDPLLPYEQVTICVDKTE